MRITESQLRKVIRNVIKEQAMPASQKVRFDPDKIADTLRPRSMSEEEARIWDNYAGYYVGYAMTAGPDGMPLTDASGKFVIDNYKEQKFYDMVFNQNFSVPYSNNILSTIKKLLGIAP